MVGDSVMAKMLRNRVNTEASRLRYDFYQSKIASLENSSSKDWWKHMKSLMGMSRGGNSELLGLANMHTGGDMEALSNTINNFLVYVSSDLPRFSETHNICQHTDPLPAAFTISVKETEDALNKVKVNKATGPDNIPPWILRDFSHILAAPLAAIYLVPYVRLCFLVCGKQLQ